MTRVYLFCGEGGALSEELASLLPDWRRKRYESLRREKSRQASLRAGLLYTYALRQCGADPVSEVTVLPAGKPVLARREDLFFSLSHSGNWAMCAVSSQPVGADIQCRRTVKSSMTRWFHPLERARLEALSGEAWEAEFFRLWTRKEAWVKAVSGEKTLSLAAEDVLHPAPGLFFRDYTLSGGCQAAVCALEENIHEPVTVEERELLAGLF